MTEAAVTVERAVSDGDAAGAARREAEALAALSDALAALSDALAALDRFVAGYAFANSSQARMVRAMVGALRGMRPSANEGVGAVVGVEGV